MAEQTDLAEILETVKAIRKEQHELSKFMTMIWETVNDDHKQVADMNISFSAVTATQKEILDALPRQTNVIANKMDQKIDKAEDRILEKVASDVPEKAREGIVEALIKLKPKIVQEQSKRSWNPLKLFRRKKSYILAK